MNYWYALLAFAAGAVLPVQVGVNNTLRGGIGSPVLAALASFVVGSAGLLIYALASRAPWPTLQAMSRLPAWAWLGGMLGAYYIATAIIVSPRLGAANLIGIVVAAQLFSALLLDHYGALGFAQHSINLWRVGGALLLVIGSLMILKN